MSCAFIAAAVMPRQVDMWGLGVLLHALLLASPPFTAPHGTITNAQQQLAFVQSSTLKLPETLSVFCQDILNRMLSVSR